MTRADRPPGRGDGPMFTRAELLGGLPARRASTALFAIEGRTAQLAAASRINRASYAGERTAAEREQQFLKSIAAGAEVPRPVAITDLERFAPDWAPLARLEPDGRAAVARLLAAKHRFRAADVPRLRAALGLDDPAVAAAYARLHGQPLNAIYAPGLPLRERLRWRLARIAGRFDRLPPFWIAYFIGLTETLGEGIMSVPLALAGLGPLPGVILLLVLGLVNLVTIAAITESVTRSGSMRYGTAYFSRLVRELLGRVPSTSMNVALALFNVLTFFVYLLGFGSVLTGATGVPLGVWIALLFAINVVLLRNETLDDTIASAVVVGTVNVALVIAITAVAAVHIDPANLAYANVPVLNGQPIDAALVGLVFGVLLVAFFGHTAPANAAKMVLTLEPTGRALLWGNLAALGTIIVLYACASVAFLGVLGPTPLLETRGTAITPLGDAVGPVIHLLGALYVVLAVGIGSLYVSLGLYNQVIELLPRPADARAQAGALARLASTRRGRLLVGFAPAALVVVALEAIVLTGQDDFAGPIALGGVLAVPIVTGIVPLLLVVAARRKGEYVPGTVIRLVGHPIVVAGLLGLFVFAVVAHALVIWEGVVERAAALVVAAVAVWLIARVMASRVLTRRAVVELRLDRRHGRTTLSVTGAGQTIVSEGPVNPDRSVDLPAGRWRELRVWPHEVSVDGWSLPLAARVELGADGGVVRHDIVASPDPVLLPVGGEPLTVRVQLREGSHA